MILKSVEYGKYLLILILSFSPVFLFSQSVLNFDSSSPEVGSLLRVKDPSVDLYTGRPNISLPLYTMNLKNFSYDIQLIYNAEGHKVDLPVSNVGLGWSISGGQIYRVANGERDEYGTLSEYLTRTEMPDWSLESNLYRYYKQSFTEREYMQVPDLDEFIINIGKINASFFIFKDKTGQVKTKISSQNSPYFEIKDVKIGKIPEFLLANNEFKSPFTGNLFRPKLYVVTSSTSIMEITIVDSEGVTYVFGGDINSIDLSCLYRQDLEYKQYYNTNGDMIGEHNIIWDKFKSDFFGIPSAWHIKKIILPNKENIEFNYSKGNVNIIERFDQHESRTSDPTGFSSPYSCSIAVKMNPRPGANSFFLVDKTYDIVYPSLLTSIYASNGDYAKFVSSKRNDLPTYGFYKDHQYTLKDNYGGVLDKIIEKNYFFKLDEIVANTGSIKLYYTDKPSQRLKLDSLLINESEKYKFLYNPLLLPNFNQMVSDNWGYYNGKSYSNMISNLQFSTLYSYRQPDSIKVKAELLERIIYPTGGESIYEYELHRYSKIATQYPFDIKPETGISGGVRIKRITVSNRERSSENIVKEYLYLNEDNTSSGVLSVVPKYSSNGTGRIDYDYRGMSYHGNYSYYVNSSTNVNWADKFHMSYSCVIEMLSDGSKTVYSYVNHDQVKDEPSVGVYNLNMNDQLYNKCISRNLDRGLLSSIKYYGKFNKLLKAENFSYNIDLSDYLKTINRYAVMNTLPVRISANKIYTYFPSLKKKVTTNYFEGGNLEEIEEYKYNKYRLLTQYTKNINGSGSAYETKTKYLIDLMEEYNNINSAPMPDSSPIKIYDNMKVQKLYSFPVEKTTLKSGNVISSEIVTYKDYENNAVKDKIYKLEPNTPLNNYSPFKIVDSNRFSFDSRCSVEIEYVNYDLYGNPVYVIERNGISSVFLWSYIGQHLVAEIKNATYGEVKAALDNKAPESLSPSANPDTILINGLRVKLPKAHVTTYIYKPLVGITEITNPMGITTFYNYNIQNRVDKIVIKDDKKNSYLIKQYEYNYRNQ